MEDVSEREEGRGAGERNGPCHRSVERSVRRLQVRRMARGEEPGERHERRQLALAEQQPAHAADADDEQPETQIERSGWRRQIERERGRLLIRVVHPASIGPARRPVQR